MLRLLLLLLALPTLAHADEAGDQALASMRTAYARLSSYTDQGSVSIQLSSSAPYELRFHTEFAGPAQFSFSWDAPHPFPPLKHLVRHHRLWIDGQDAWSSSGMGADKILTRKEDSINMAVAGATGISHGAAHTIAKLLFPDQNKGPFLDGATAHIIGTDELEGTACTHVQVQHPRLGQLELWIAQHDQLLRKLSSVTLRTTEIRRDIHAR